MSLTLARTGAEATLSGGEIQTPIGIESPPAVTYQSVATL